MDDARGNGGSVAGDEVTVTARLGIELGSNGRLRVSRPTDPLVAMRMLLGAIDVLAAQTMQREEPLVKPVSLSNVAGLAAGRA